MANSTLAKLTFLVILAIAGVAGVGVAYNEYFVTGGKNTNEEQTHRIKSNEVALGQHAQVLDTHGKGITQNSSVNADQDARLNTLTNRANGQDEKIEALAAKDLEHDQRFDDQDKENAELRKSIQGLKDENAALRAENSKQDARIEELNDDIQKNNERNERRINRIYRILGLEHDDEQ